MNTGHNSNSVKFIDMQNNDGDTALHLAAMYGFEDIVEYLLQMGASTTLLNFASLKAFQCAGYASLADYIRSHEKKRTLLDITANTLYNVSGVPENSSFFQLNPRSSLTYSLSEDVRRVPEVKLLPNDWLEPSNLIYTALHEQHHVHAEQTDLMSAAQQNDVSRIQELLKTSNWLGCDLPALKVDWKGTKYYPLVNVYRKLCHPLCSCNSCSPLQELHRRVNAYELHTNSCNYDGVTAFHQACCSDSVESLWMLLRLGANLKLMTLSRKLTALHIAAMYNSIQCVELILRFASCLECSDLDANVDDDWDVKEWKIVEEDDAEHDGECNKDPNPMSVRSLKHALLMSEDELGNLPIHLAVLHGNPGILQQILNSCIRNTSGELPKQQLSWRNHAHQTVYDIAISYERTKSLEVIQEYQTTLKHLNK